MQFSQGILDIIGVFIGFISIILLLSILVTSLVQAFQSSLRLRARNLKKGLQSIIDTHWQLDSKASGDFALKALNAKHICILGRKSDPTTTVSRLIGPAISYINPKDLPEALREAGLEIGPQLERKVLDSFNRIWNQMENRFLNRIRLLTLLCSAVVAGYFQFSAPELLSRLSSDDQLRVRLVGEVEGSLSSLSMRAGNDAAVAALADLETQYPELKGEIEALKSDGGGKDVLAARLAEVLADSSQDRSAILNRYDQLFEKALIEQKKVALREGEKAINALAKINIAGWPHGVAFYYTAGAVQWGNLIGVLVTAILLSFGAPFWFERLKNVVKFKDALSKGLKTEDGGKR
jgi:hypothetical protein